MSTLQKLGQKNCDGICVIGALRARLARFFLVGYVEERLWWPICNGTMDILACWAALFHG